MITYKWDHNGELEISSDCDEDVDFFTIDELITILKENPKIKEVNIIWEKN